MISPSTAHDLRARLHAIVGFSDMVMADEGPRLSAQGQEDLGRVVSNALRLAKLIDTLMPKRRKRLSA